MRTPLVESPPGPVVTIDGRPFLYFSGTAYLCLQSRDAVVAAIGEAAARYGVHSSTSRLRAGVSPTLRDAENEAAAFFGTDTAVVCASGYLSPWMLLQAILPAYDSIFLDRRAHVALRDAAACSRLPVVEVDVAAAANDLVEGLKRAAGAGQRPLALVDGVFSATGELAPLADVHDRLAACPGAGLLVDDAHGFGCLGAMGRGSLEAAGLWDRANRMDADDTAPGVFVCGTLSKALGGFGGVVPASDRLAAAVAERSHAYRGAAALAAPLAAASAAALRIARAEPELRRRLAANLAQLDEGLGALGLARPGTAAPIRCIRSADPRQLDRMHEALRELGIFVPLVRGYGGAAEGGVLRIAVSAGHTPSQIRQLLDALAGIR
jgi:8-amino-7-oxononanoate synthase